MLYSRKELRNMNGLIAHPVLLFPSLILSLGLYHVLQPGHIFQGSHTHDTVWLYYSQEARMWKRSA